MQQKDIVTFISILKNTLNVRFTTQVYLRVDLKYFQANGRAVEIVAAYKLLYRYFRIISLKFVRNKVKIVRGYTIFHPIEL